MRPKEIIKRFIKRFIQVKYENNRVQPYLHFRLPLLLAEKGKKSMRIYLHGKLPFSLDRHALYRRLYAGYPVQQNKVVLDNYMGKGFGCNAKYVAQKLLEKYPGELDLVWIVSKGDMKNGDFPEGIRLVDYASPEARKEYATAKVWVSNYHKISFVRKGMYRKPDQHFIQMWHGSLGIKKIESDVSILTDDENWLTLAQESSRMVTHWISNSTFETSIYHRAFWDVENVLEYGHPRNDLLVTEPERMRSKVEEFFGIQGKNILFYAPTFREDYRLDCYRIDYAALKEALEERFGGEWVFVVRLHPRVRKYSSQVIPNEPYMLDGTYYADIQELMAASDAMITDYSSCIYDFILTRRPGFIFATDVDDYVDERGFYYPLEATPFPIAHDNYELVRSVRQFQPEQYARDVEAFLENKGCMEDGHASERVADLIAELTGIKKELSE